MDRKENACSQLRTGDTVRIGAEEYTLEVADTFASRFFGLIGRETIAPNKALLIIPCNSIHTFFMRFRMTAVFVDKEMRVVKVVPNMPAWRMTFASKAYCVFELLGDKGSDIKEGDKLTQTGYAPEQKSVPFYYPTPSFG